MPLSPVGHAATVGEEWMGGKSERRRAKKLPLGDKITQNGRRGCLPYVLVFLNSQLKCEIKNGPLVSQVPSGNRPTLHLKDSFWEPTRPTSNKFLLGIHLPWI